MQKLTLFDKLIGKKVDILEVNSTDYAGTELLRLRFWTGFALFLTWTVMVRPELEK